MTFEEKLAKLEQLSKDMEKGQPIEKSMEIFKEATLLVKECKDYLEEKKGELYIVKQDLEKYREEKM